MGWLLTIGLAGGLWAQAMKGFVPTQQYLVEIDDEISPDARLYWSATARSFLLVAPALSNPTLLSPAGGRVSTVPVISLAVKPSGSVDILAGADITPAGTLNLSGGSPRFTVDGHRVALVTKPDLLGWQNPADFVAYDKEYGERAEAYQPDRSAIAELRAIETPARLTVYFGSWCSHCQQKVPLTMKIAEALAGSNIEIVFYGLPGDVVSDPLAKRLKLRGVPTGVVTRGDQELGRLLGDGWARPEVTLLKMVR
jgi:thiol-disulfide isomerase/thioredoxin